MWSEGSPTSCRGALQGGVGPTCDGPAPEEETKRRRSVEQKACAIGIGGPSSTLVAAEIERFGERAYPGGMTDHTAPLSPDHERFVLEFLDDGDAIRADLDAGTERPSNHRKQERRVGSRPGWPPASPGTASHLGAGPTPMDRQAFPSPAKAGRREEIHLRSPCTLGSRSTIENHGNCRPPVRLVDCASPRVWNAIGDHPAPGAPGTIENHGNPRWPRAGACAPAPAVV
jgi:hypothetical protein